MPTKPDTVTMLEFRQHALAVVERVRKGQSVVLTYRGRPAVRLEPIAANHVNKDDAFYTLAELADAATGRESLNNSDLDRIIYGV